MTNLNCFNDKSPKVHSTPATKPWEYPLGSLESRAAARAMLSPVYSLEDQQIRKVAETLSNEELDALISFIILEGEGKESETTPEQHAAVQLFHERLAEIKTTGSLSAKRWGN